MRLQTKVLLLLAPLVALPIVTVGALAYLELRANARAEAEQAMITDLRGIGQDLGAVLRTGRANVVLFSESQLVRRYLLTESEEDRYVLLQPSLLRQLASYQRAYPEYYEIRVISLDGFEDTRATLRPLPNVTEFEHTQPFYRQLRESPAALYQGLDWNPDDGRYVLTVARRVEIADRSVDPVNAPAKPRGYVALTVALGALEIAAAEAAPDTGGLVFIDDSGRSVFEGGVVAKDTASSAADRDALLSSVGQTDARRIALDGVRYLAIGRPLTEGLSVVALTPYAAVVATAHTWGVVVAGATVLAVLLITGLLYWLLSYLVVRPVLDLARAADGVSRGELDVDIGPELRRADEMGLLHRTFGDMLASLRESREQITRLAYHDALTGLPNRLLGREYLVHALTRAQREGTQLAVLFIDLDNFKQVNDTVGHAAGDELLKRFAERIQATLRGSDILARAQMARLGGDEFVVLLNEIASPQSAASVAERILTPFRNPVRLEGQEFSVTASVGITTYPRDGDTADALVRNADAAMYQAKREGKNAYRFYSAALNTAARERVSLEADLRRALLRGEFSLHYQPQYEIATGRVYRVEALLRWHHPDYENVSPARFIPLAEETGLILPIGEWALQEAARQCADWLKRGVAVPSIAVNVSGVQLQRQDLATLVQEASDAHGLSPSHLQLELTETALVTASHALSDRLRAVRALGATVALDDFGTGYSSMTHLQGLPLDALKIDRRFVGRMASDPGSQAIVEAMVGLARALELEVVAEGVETQTEQAMVLAAGCPCAQGFLFSRPLAPDALEALLAARAGPSLLGPSDPATKGSVLSG